MNTKRFVLFATAILLFLFSTLAAWYEGAQIYDNPWEWEHTALVSNYINGSAVMLADQIVWLDHFIYAAKFQPLFPLLMVLSFLSLVFMVLQPVLKRSAAITLVSCLVLAAVSFSVAVLLGNSPTQGFSLFSIFFGALGVVTSGYLVYFLTKFKSRAVPLSKS